VPGLVYLLAWSNADVDRNVAFPQAAAAAFTFAQVGQIKSLSGSWE